MIGNIRKEEVKSLKLAVGTPAVGLTNNTPDASGKAAKGERAAKGSAANVSSADLGNSLRPVGSTAADLNRGALLRPEPIKDISKVLAMRRNIGLSHSGLKVAYSSGYINMDDERG